MEMPTIQLGVWGSIVSYPSVVRARALAENGFYAYLRSERSHLEQPFQNVWAMTGPPNVVGPGKTFPFLSPLLSGLPSAIDYLLQTTFLLVARGKKCKGSRQSEPLTIWSRVYLQSRQQQHCSLLSGCRRQCQCHRVVAFVRQILSQTHRRS